jgi:peroxiredoxin Q/BCP
MQNQTAPDFELNATGGEAFRLSRNRGHKLVLYFYPKDNTPGCISEAIQFRDLHDQFLAAGCKVFGLSRDSLKSHESFKAKFSLPFELISDPDEVACNLFGVMKQKMMYGKSVRGIERSTFLIDAKGVVHREWRAVKVPEHAPQVLEHAKALG